MKIVGGCAVAALLLIYGCFAAPLAFDQDAVHYLSLAEHLARGDGYRSSLHYFHDLLQPPLFPMVVAAFIKLGFSTLTAGAIVCIAAALATLVAMARLHVQIWGARGQLATIAIAAVYVNLAHALNLTLEALFLCLLAWGVERVFHGLLRDRPRAVLLGGFLLGAALLVRSEAVMSLAVMAALIAAWRAPMARRATRLVGFVLAAALVIVPYGLWMRAQLGWFEVLPKIRYNLPLPEITSAMKYEPDESEARDRDHKALHSLMPDGKTFILNYAFEHRDFDAASAYPRRPEGAHDGKHWLRGARVVIFECAYFMGFLHPLSLIFLVAAAVALIREAENRRARLLLAGAVAAQAAAHLVPALASGEDFMTRYLCTSTMFAVVLVGGGAGAVESWALRRWPARPIGMALALALAAQYALITFRAPPLWFAGSPAVWAHLRAVEAGAHRALPGGARVLSNHARPAFVVGGFAFQMPYVRTLEELQAYIGHHAIDYAVFDMRTLGRHPSRALRELGNPSTWPAGWTLVERVNGAAPVFFVRLR